MIVAFSTSSPVCSVALLSEEGDILGRCERVTKQNASAACLEMLTELCPGERLHEVRLFGADTGPGSFIGTRVGVTLAKTLAFSLKAKCAGASSFDLISLTQAVVIPNKKGEWFLREPSCPPVLVDAEQEKAIGYGMTGEAQYPDAARFADLLGSLERIEPELLLPTPIVEPSISKPKQPYREPDR